MGRTATFKSGERYIRPTGSATPPEGDATTENSLFREVDATGTPVTTSQTEGAHPLDASAPAEVVADPATPSEIDERGAQTVEDEFEPSEAELEQFRQLTDGGMSDAEAAAEVWPGIVFTSDDSTESEESTETVAEENSDAGSTEETAESEETAPETEETAEEAETAEEETTEASADEESTEETVTPDDEPDWDKPYPQGAPTAAWKVGQIDAWALDQDPVVTFPEGATKNAKLTQLKPTEG